ncbi:UNVERIFIED_CONTAM: hypothetical protein K2H54_004206 [Gekko kuhli]
MPGVFQGRGPAFVCPLWQRPGRRKEQVEVVRSISMKGHLDSSSTSSTMQLPTLPFLTTTPVCHGPQGENTVEARGEGHPSGTGSVRGKDTVSEEGGVSEGDGTSEKHNISKEGGVSEEGGVSGEKGSGRPSQDLELRGYQRQVDHPFKGLRESLATSAKDPHFLINKPKDVSAQVKRLPSEMEKSRELLQERKKQYRSLFYKTARGASGPWKFHGKSLYYFSKGEKTWHDAESFCVSRGAHLASILDHAEQNFISSEVQHTSWIGLQVENEGGRWRWSDGSRLVKEYWSEDQSSNAKVFKESSQDCTVIVPSLTYRNWNENNCHELYRWVCKDSLDLGEP